MVDQDRGELSPREARVAALPTREIYQLYYGELQTLDRIGGIQRLVVGGGGVATLIGTYLGITGLVTYGLPMAVGSYMGGEFIKSEHVIMRDILRAEIKYRKRFHQGQLS